MHEVEVLLLTQSDCSFCDDAKDVLETLSKEYTLAVRVLDVASVEGRDLASQGGILFPPGLFLDGEPFSYGRVSARKLRKALGKRLARA